MIATTILVFAAVFAVILTISLAVIRARQSAGAKLKSRLRRMAASDDERHSDGHEAILNDVAPAHRIFYRLPLMGSVKEMVERSGVHITPIILVLLTGGASVSCVALVFALKENIYLAVAAGFAIALAAFCFFKYRIKKRAAKFTEQLPDALVMISRSLRAGHSLTGAVELVSEELADPAGTLFKLAYEQQKFGMRIGDSLATLPEKIDSLDLQFFVTIIRINSETGGNLAEILDKLAETIRSRLQIRRQVQVYTAEGRMSGYVLVILPMFVFGLFYLMHPNYMDVFFTERVCQFSLIAAVIAQGIGFMFIRKIVNIRI